MGWAKFDDRRHTNGKLIAAGLAANGLDANGITYCAANETDGFIADNALPVLAPTTSAKTRASLVQALVDNGRWERDDTRRGWWIHDYLDYHPSRTVQEQKREADRLRKKGDAATKPRDADGRFVPAGIQAESAGIPTGLQAASTTPVPSLPDPSPPIPREMVTSPNNSSLLGDGGGENREVAMQKWEGGKLRETVVRLAEVCKGENREAVMRESAIVIGLCSPHTPPAIVERAIAIIAPKNPVLPRFALKEIGNQRRLAGLPAIVLSIDAIVKRAAS